MGIEYLDNTADIRSIVDSLRRNGAVVVTDVAESSLLDSIVTDLKPQLAKDGLDSAGAFNGKKTLRESYGLLTTAPDTASLVDHDLVVAVADEILLPHCATYTLGSMSAIEILPGETAQPLHRDDSLYPIENAGMELLIGVMWALDDFTEENGGTRVVPRSHRFLRSWHLPDLSGWESATMAKGSVLFYMGSTWHGGGANNSEGSRLGLINTYSLGWLRTESNHILDCPPDVAAKFSPRLRALLGYTPHGCGDDVIGEFEGDCPAWLDRAPEPAWRDDRGQVGSMKDADAQDGV